MYCFVSGGLFRLLHRASLAPRALPRDAYNLTSSRSHTTTTTPTTYHRPPPTDMPIVEHAFSYGGLLVRTFRHADAAPPSPLPPHPSEPSWVEPPPPKRQKRTPRTTEEPPTPTPTDPSEGDATTWSELWQRQWQRQQQSPPVRYMQETGCVTDVDRFKVDLAGCGPFYAAGYDADDGISLQGVEEAGTDDGGGSGDAQAPPPVPRPVVNDHSLYFPTFPAKPPEPDIPTSYLPPAPPSIPPEPTPTPTPTPTTAVKQPRGRPRKADVPRKPAKPAAHHCDSASALLTHIRQTLASAAAEFIPRPLLATYTLPLPASASEFKPLAQTLVRGITAADGFAWAVAHSQWTTSKSNPTIGARWVCNRSEEVRERNGGL